MVSCTNTVRQESCVPDLTYYLTLCSTDFGASTVRHW
jgi:hypothetical protein